MLLKQNIRPHSPIRNSLFEITYKGKGNNDLLAELNMGYNLKADSDILLVKYSSSEEELYNIVGSVKLVEHISILVHDATGTGLLKITADVKYKGPVIEQSFDSNDFFNFTVAYSISNLETRAQYLK